MTFIITAQMLTSIILGPFGFLNLPIHSFSLARIGGAALVIAGVFLGLRT